MTRRVVILTLTAAVAAVLLYLSRFWVWRLWDRGAVFDLPPQGGLLARWLRGTEAAPFELLLWAVGGFLVLTAVQAVVDRVWPAAQPKGDDHDD